MFIEMKTFKLELGSSEHIIERFSKGGVITEQPGFVDLTVMKKVRRDDHEEVIIMLRFDSQASYTNWKKSDAHQAGHAQKKERPPFILDVKMDTYDVKTFKTKS